VFGYTIWQEGPSETTSPPRTIDTVGQQSGDNPHTTSGPIKYRQRQVPDLYRRMAIVSFS
jgi:hypothetical protein